MKLMWLGFVFLMAIFLLAIGILLVENFSIFTSPNYFYVGFEQVQGLREGDDIRVEGIPFGKIYSLILHPDGVLVKGKLSEPLTLYGDPSQPDGYRITVEPASMVKTRPPAATGGFSMRCPLEADSPMSALHTSPSSSGSSRWCMAWPG